MILQNISDYDTTLGKWAATFDGIGVALSISFYWFGLGELVNSILPPIVLVLTVISLTFTAVLKGIAAVSKCKSEYRAWKQKRKNK